MKHQSAAGGIIFRLSEDGEQKTETWLICQHSQHKGWVFPKGIIGDSTTDESMEDAALREVKEEGGIEAKIIAKLPKAYEYIYTFEGEKIKKTVHYFLMEYVSGDPANHDWEMSEAKFITEQEIKELLTYPTDKQAFEDAIRILKKE